MNINDMYAHLDGLFRDGKIADVEPYLLEQLVAANQEHDTNASLSICNELTGFYRSRERYTEAINVAEQALKLCASEYILGSLSHATTLLNAATAYRFGGNPVKALELFKQAEAIYNEKLPLNDEHYGSLLNNMSAAYAETGDSNKAAECLLRAAAIMDALPARVLEAAITHANLASLYFETQNYYGAKMEIANACNMLEQHSEYAAQYQQFKAMQETLNKY